MIAAAIISSWGPLLATMPGMAFAKKPRMSLSNETRKGAVALSPRRRIRISSCKSPAMPTIAARISAARAASCRQNSSTAITAISAMLNSSGEKAVSANRPCAFMTAISTVTGPAKAR
jgi:hypothetical protein